MNTSLTIAEKLESIIGPGHVCAASAKDIVAGVQPEYVVSPGTEGALAAVLASANEAGVAVIPRGGGTKLDWGNPAKRTGIILSTLRLNRVLEHPWADLTVSVEAGCTLQTLKDTLAKHGQRLALDALWPERATVGGVLSSNDSGALRLRFGSLRDLIIGVTLALPDGTLASSGGKVVKNVAGYDLPKLATGAFGTLGIITRAIFRLHPACRNSLTLRFGATNIEAMQGAILAIQNSQLAHTALQIRVSQASELQADILFEATPAGLLAQKAKLQKLLPDSEIRESNDEVWLAKQRLWDDGEPPGVLGKFSVLPTCIAKTIRELEKIATSGNLPWQVVLQATGIGWLRVDGDAAQRKLALERCRRYLETAGGSLIILRQSQDANAIDAWGSPGDAIGVMRALKRELDPKATLNPGRFVGGI